MAEERLVEILNDCVDRLAQGEKVDDCLRAYPEYATQLAPMLEAGRLAYRAQSRSQEVSQSQQRVGFRFEQALMQMQQPVSRPQRHFPMQRLGSLVASVVLMIIMLTSGTVALAQNSLPGDALYGIKLWSEGLRLSLSGKDSLLEMEFQQRRFEETRQLIETGREAEVTLVGVIDTVADSTMSLGGLTIQLHDVDLTDQPLVPGSRIQVLARTTRGEVQALSINVIDVPIIPTATPTLTPSLVPTDPPTNTPLPTNTLSPTASQTRAATATITRTPTPSRTPNDSDRPTDATDDSSNRGSASCVDDPPSDWVAYRLQEGDTLSELSLNTGTDLAAVMRANCIEDARGLLIGQEIYLPREPVRRRATATPEPTRIIDPTYTPSGEGRRDPTSVPTARNPDRGDNNQNESRRDSGDDGGNGGRSR